MFVAGESPWTEEPGGLQFMRSQRVRYDLSTKTTATIHVLTCFTVESGVWEQLFLLKEWASFLVWFGRTGFGDMEGSLLSGQALTYTIEELVENTLIQLWSQLWLLLLCLVTALSWRGFICRDSLVAIVTLVLSLGPSSVGGNVYII